MKYLLPSRNFCLHKKSTDELSPSADCVFSFAFLGCGKGPQDWDGSIPFSSAALPACFYVLIIWRWINRCLPIFFALVITIILWFNKKVSETLEPYLVILNSLPKSALAPLLIVWLGANYNTIIITGISVAVFGSILSLYTSFQSIDPEKIKLIQTLGGTKYHILTKVIIPASIPSFFSIMKVNIGLCLVGVIIGEFISSRQGLGYLIIYGSQVFKLDWVIMSIVILCLLAWGLYSLLSHLEKRYLRFMS